MATNTEKLSLVLPDGNDTVEVGELNGNFRKLDEAYGQLSDDTAACIGQELEQTIITPTSGNAIATIPFKILKGQAYLLSLGGEISTATITTRETNMGSTVETLYAGPAADVVVYPQHDANFVRYVGKKGAVMKLQTVTSQMLHKELALVRSSVNIAHTYVVAPDGSGDYTSFCACVEEAIKYENSVVIVRPGTYDVLAEMTALHGENYFTDFTSSTDQLELMNGIHIIGDPGAVLNCHYTGNNAYVNSHFSPINLKQFDATLENVEINASNVRYCIHDDQWTATEHYKHVLKNCRLCIDNSGNANWDRRLAFGGGFGVNGYVQFDNCYFSAAGLDGTAYSGYGSMGYHNSPSADAQSTIVVNNCYFADNSTFRLTRHGASTKMTRAFVSGCSFGRAMELTYEQTSSTPQNCEIIDCSNTIRS